MTPTCCGPKANSILLPEQPGPRSKAELGSPILSCWFEDAGSSQTDSVLPITTNTSQLVLHDNSDRLVVRCSLQRCSAVLGAVSRRTTSNARQVGTLNVITACEQQMLSHPFQPFLSTWLKVHIMPTDMKCRLSELQLQQCFDWLVGCLPCLAT